IRRAIQMGRRKQAYAGVSPSEFPWQIGYRHHLDHRDYNTRQLFQLLRRGVPRSFLCARGDMLFVDYMAFPGNVRPMRIGPAELCWVDDARGTVRSIRLKS